MVKRRNLLHFNNGARSERDLGDLVTKVFEKAAKKEPQPLYTFSLPLLSVQDDIRVYCKKKNIKIGYDTLFMEITFSADREAVDELIKHFFSENKLYLRGRFYLSAAVV
ncbi:glucose-6-phosphate dehydrogenase [Salmonella enterica]|nr:glucose-6-phosphate dehydrogenase [Salmonella enterica]EBN7336619.1 glucose-6-phosphate dehydrogenase [Salmonella enterica]EJG5372079.1 glucose-6-phosphate dehydrogenase [Salmonella enterica]EMC9021533.1 glucose-6-phosphate dehydrogenase [Salmonella enterica]